MKIDNDKLNIAMQYRNQLIKEYGTDTFHNLVIDHILLLNESHNDLLSKTKDQIINEFNMCTKKEYDGLSLVAFYELINAKELLDIYLKENPLKPKPLTDSNKQSYVPPPGWSFVK